jgi:hypothetical protein
VYRRSASEIGSTRASRCEWSVETTPLDLKEACRSSIAATQPTCEPVSMPLTSPRVSTSPVQAGVAGSRYLPGGRSGNLALPGRIVRQRDVVPQVVARIVGGGDAFDVEALVERAGSEIRGLERGVDRVVDLVGGLIGGDLVDAEDVRELGLEPELDRRHAVGLPVRAQDAKGVARLLWRELRPADAQVRRGHALRVQHPVDVVVWG